MPIHETMSIREFCEAEDYRERLSCCFGWFGTLCSVETAMLLTAVDVMAGRNTLGMSELIRVCMENGMSRDEIRAACCELHELEAVDFYQNIDREVIARFTLRIDADEVLSPHAAILLAME